VTVFVLLFEIIAALGVPCPQCVLLNSEWGRTHGFHIAQFRFRIAIPVGCHLYPDRMIGHKLIPQRCGARRFLFPIAHGHLFLLAASSPLSNRANIQRVNVSLPNTNDDLRRGTHHIFGLHTHGHLRQCIALAAEFPEARWRATYRVVPHIGVAARPAPRLDRREGRQSRSGHRHSCRVAG